MRATSTKYKPQTRWELQGPNTNPTMGATSTKHKPTHNEATCTKYKPQTHWELQGPNKNPKIQWELRGSYTDHTHHGSFKGKGRN